MALPKRGPGRPKGSVNKVTGDIREMVMQALERLGGQKFLVEAAKNPQTAAAFIALIGKCMPKDIIIDSTVRHVTDISDEELVLIATGRSTGIAEASPGEDESSGVH